MRFQIEFTSKELHFNADFKYLSFISLALHIKSYDPVLSHSTDKTINFKS